MPLLKSPLDYAKMRISLFFLLAIVSITTNAQFNITDKGDGVHDFTSDYSDNDLHFYLYDDGYHSFEAEPTHVFGSTSVSPEVYHIGPYDDDDVYGYSTGDPGSSNSSPVNAPAEIDGEIEVIRSWNLVEGKENFFILMFQNTSENEVWDGCVEFHFHSARASIDAADILDNYGNDWVNNKKYYTSSAQPGTNRRYTWNYENLQPREQTQLWYCTY